MTCQFPSALPAVATNMTNETTRYSISTASVSGSLTVPILQPRHPPVGMHVTPRGGFPLRVLYKFSSYISAETPKSPPRNYQQSLTRLLLLIHRPSRTHPQTPDSPRKTNNHTMPRQLTRSTQKRKPARCVKVRPANVLEYGLNEQAHKPDLR